MPSSTSGGKVACRLSMLLRSCASVVAPMMFLMIWKHSLGGCLPHGDFDPERFLESQIDYLLHGMCQPLAATTPPSSPPTP